MSLYLFTWGGICMDKEEILALLDDECARATRHPYHRTDVSL